MISEIMSVPVVIRYQQAAKAPLKQYNKIGRLILPLVILSLGNQGAITPG
jgi:hypothetical protein